MEKEFITYEHALALKELGFDEPCYDAYNHDGGGESTVPPEKYNHRTDVIAAPLYQQAFRWFREKCNLSHEIQHTHKGFYPLIYEDNIIKPKWVGEVLLYEEAEQACLDKLIEIIKASKTL